MAKKSSSRGKRAPTAIDAAFLRRLETQSQPPLANAERVFAAFCELTKEEQAEVYADICISTPWLIECGKRYQAELRKRTHAIIGPAVELHKKVKDGAAKGGKAKALSSNEKERRKTLYQAIFDKQVKQDPYVTKVEALRRVSASLKSQGERVSYKTVGKFVIDSRAEASG